MFKKYLLVFSLLVSISFTNSSNAQFRNYNIKGGVQFLPLLPFSEFDARFSFLGRGFVNFELSNVYSLELGVGYGQYKTDDHYNTYPVTSTGDHDVSTDIIPIDVRLRISPWAKTAKNWNPYFYIGGGVMNYNVKNVPADSTIPAYNTKESGWAGIVPVGLGTEIKLSNSVLLDLSGGATYSTTDLLNNFVITDFKDAYAQLGVGITFAGSDMCNTDEDKDGLTYCKEEQIGTNPEIADTDGDGCLDGAEVNQYKTDPLNKDTDGDTLLDCDEVMKYSTNPLSKDTDADGLMDNEEIQKYLTIPTNPDTDGDGLKDGDEVMKYKTDPKDKDTDHGTIGDGIEVDRGTDPLNPADDIPPPPVEEKVKVGQVITLEGINFATNKWEITSLAEDKLEVALNAMKDNPNVEVEIIGNTDNTGSRNWNMELSEKRAESVKEWFVSKGISGSRITTKGVGPDDPIAPNDTEEGRYKNRRIDFKRIK
ncbi:MAG TPA: OmpA family protein [Ignavibacteria bacterium]|nr:OmpA family protein [Ignavibacteria bacterium]